MSLTFEEPAKLPGLDDVAVFLSASIPDPRRWQGDFDPLEITDAVVSMARVFLTAGATIVTAAHPTVAPLLMYVASELRPDAHQVTIYQSALFDDVLPDATRRFEAEGVGTVVWTRAAPGDEPRPGSWDPSLNLMRRQMFAESDPAAAVFIGGMTGITTEWELFEEMFPGRPRYPLGPPGGEARRLVPSANPSVRATLAEGRSYPAVWRSVAAHLGEGFT
jgi:SLOG cluster3 family